jgi:hypothetical protein
LVLVHFQAATGVHKVQGGSAGICLLASHSPLKWILHFNDRNRALCSQQHQAVL